MNKTQAQTLTNTDANRQDTGTDRQIDTDTDTDIDCMHLLRDSVGCMSLERGVETDSKAGGRKE